MSEENIRYFTGFSSSNGYLIITENTSFFLTDSRYIEAAQKIIFSVDEILETKGMKQTIAPLIENLGIKKLSLEISKTTLSMFTLLKSLFPNITFDISLSLDSEINSLRAVKSKTEIQKIAKAQSIAELAFDYILTFIKPGVTEKQVALQLDYVMRKNGADGISFETIAVAGANGSKPHGVPGDYKISNGDFITMDFGALFDGYHSDMTRTVAVGAVSEKQLEVYNTVLKAQLAGMEKIKAGTPCKDVDSVARAVIENAGYGDYFGHSYGHGVGIEIHEHPFEGPSSNEILASGNVVTAEPGIYIPGEFGVRIEDMLLVTDDGFNNFTKCKKELIVL